MKLVRWRPFEDLLRWNERVNRLMGSDFFEDEDLEKVSMTAWKPTTDIYETKDEYVFKVELPGIKKEEIQIEVKDDTLTIKGEKKEEKEVKKEDYHRIERCCGNFTRVFNLPQHVDEKKISASMKEGVLEVRVPKAEKSKTKAIPINIK